MLVLKHRQNKNQRQRIVMFVGSPITDSEEVLKSLGEKLKKNNVSIDVISFGEHEENESKLTTLVNTVNQEDNCHLVTIPPSGRLLSDVLLNSPVFMDAGAMGGMGAADVGGNAGGNSFEFGVDPNVDPELAMALKMSMEEAKARAEKETGGNVEGNAGNAGNVDAESLNMQDLDEMDEELRQAIAMSLQNPEDMDYDNMSEEAQLAHALAMSVQNEGDEDDEEDGEEMNAEDMADILKTLPGVNPDDPMFQQTLQNMGGEKKDDKKKDDKEKKKDDQDDDNKK